MKKTPTKKKLLLSLAGLGMCLTTSCSLIDAINGSFSLICYDENGEIVLDEAVSMTKQINTPELRYVREGYNFRGWAYEPNQENPKIRPDASIRFNAYKQHVKDGKLELYAVWMQRSELTIAWDAYTAGSGLTDDFINALKPKLLSALSAEYSFTPNILWRKMEDQKIEDKTALIKKYGDVDITLGFASTISKPSGGNLTMTGLNNEFVMAGKTRTLGRLNNKDLSVFTYDWLNDPSNYVKQRTSTHDLVFGWGWNGNVGSSPATGVLDYQRIKPLEEGLRHHIEQAGYQSPDFVYRKYRCSPAYECGEAINADGDVDLLFGFGSTISQFGEKYGNVDTYLSKTVKIDEQTRYVLQLNLGSPIVNLAYEWLSSEECLKALERSSHKTVTFGFDLRSTSGIKETMVDAFKKALATYIFINDLDLTPVYKLYSSGSTAEIGASMMEDDVDIMMGMGSNFIKEGGLSFYASKNATIDGTSGRRICQLVNYEEVGSLFDWTLENGLTYFNATIG